MKLKIDYEVHFMYCTRCGAKLEDGFLFCSVCGESAGGHESGQNVREDSSAEQAAAPKETYSYLPPQDQPDLPKKHRHKRLRIALLSAVVAVAAVAAGVFICNSPFLRQAFGQKVEVVFRPADGYKATRPELDEAVAVLKKRMDNLHITNRNIKVDYTGDSITIRFVPPFGAVGAESAVAELGSLSQLVFKSEQYDNGAVILTGADVQKATPSVDANGNYDVKLVMKSSGTKKFDAATKALAGSHGNLEIYLDNKLVETAGVDAEIDNGNAVISGGFTAASVKTLADEINEGALPFSMETTLITTGAAGSAR
jgi:hypothetical protein